MRDIFQRLLDIYWTESGITVDGTAEYYQILNKRLPDKIEELLRAQVPEGQRLSVGGHVGSGNRSKFPMIHISIDNPEIAAPLQNGLYLVYIFVNNEGRRGFYLSLNQGASFATDYVNNTLHIIGKEQRDKIKATAGYFQSLISDDAILGFEKTDSKIHNRRYPSFDDANIFGNTIQAMSLQMEN